MARLERISDPRVAQLFARAVVAVVRADGDLGLEEGLRLQDRLARRTDRAVMIEDLLLAPALSPTALAAELGMAAGPFRGAGPHPGALAAMLVADAVAIALAKGHVSALQAAAVIEFATALGCDHDELRTLAPALRPWLRPPRPR